MGEGFVFDYYYGIEAEQFSFYRVPRLLIKDKRFKGLSSDAKLLYGLMLDRMSLSVKNRWFDEDNRAYIYYTVEEIMNDLGCSHGTCTKIMSELDNRKGIGLIEKTRQGLGRPDIIYVKNFVTACASGPIEDDERKSDNTDVFTEVQNLDFRISKNQTSRNPKGRLPEIQNLDFCKSNNRTSGNPKSRFLEVQNLDSSYTNINYTDINNINPSIHLSDNTDNNSNDRISEIKNRIDISGELSSPLHNDKLQVNSVHLCDKNIPQVSSVHSIDDVEAYIEQIKQNIRYDYHIQHDTGQDRELYDELYELICDTVCVSRKTIKIGGENYPYALVKAKFLKLNDSHLEYVIISMQNVTTKIKNIRAYLLTALYFAPNTKNHFYKQEVQYDMFGGGWEERGIV